MGMRSPLIFVLLGCETVVSWSCPQLRVGEIYAPKSPVEAVCVVSDGLPSGTVIKVEATASQGGTRGGRLCLRVQALTPPNLVREQTACGDAGSVSITLMEPTVPHTYVILPQAEGMGGLPLMRFEARTEAVSPRPKLAAAPPPAKMGFPEPAFPPSPPPLPGQPPDDSDCTKTEQETIGACRNDIKSFCHDVAGATNVLNCLIDHKPEVSIHCQVSCPSCSPPVSTPLLGLLY